MPLDTSTTWTYWVTTGSNTTAATTTWDNWVGNSRYTTSTTSANATNCWIRWNDGTTTTATVSDCWIEWQDEYGNRRRAVVSNRGNYTYCPNSGTPAPPETEEQKAARLARDEENRRRWEKQQKEREAANARARELLDSLLSDEQRRELETTGQFHVTAPSGRRYRIHRNSISGNVELAEEPGGVAPARRWRYCAHGRGADELPTYDHLAMQKLMLETDEEQFLATANRS